MYKYYKDVKRQNLGAKKTRMEKKETQNKISVLDVFSGVGGFSLGLERAGFKTVAFCEVDKKCQAVLKKHWPDVPIYHDVKELTFERLKADGIETIDVICGGFPCQDISCAGKGAGIEGSRSGLWSEYARLIGEIRPKYAIVENVPALLGRGLSRVLGDLSEIGYDAEWKIVSAQDVGAWHRRERIWIVAYPHKTGLQAAWSEIVTARLEQYRAVGKLWPTPNAGDGTRGPRKPDGKRGLLLSDCAAAGGKRMWPTPRSHLSSIYDEEDATYKNRDKKGGAKSLAREVKLFPTPTVNGNHNKKGASKTSGDGLATAIKLFPTPTKSMMTVGDMEQARFHSSKRPPYKDANRVWLTPLARDSRSFKGAQRMPNAQGSEPLVVQVGGKLNPDWVGQLMGFPVGWTDLDKVDIDLTNKFPRAWLNGSWEEGIPRVTQRKSGRVDRLKQLGNAVVPQIPELIGRAILEVGSDKIHAR